MKPKPVSTKALKKQSNGTEKIKYEINMPEELKQNNTKSGDSGKKDELQTAADYGIDISMLISNLQKTPAERIKLHQVALDTTDKLRKAKRL